MSSHFSNIASALSDEELRERINNQKKYQIEAVEAALAELKNRGIGLTEDALGIAKNKIEEQKNEKGQDNKGMKRFIVDDPAAPLFYSRRAVYAFTVFCGALFGSILLAINLGKIKNKSGIIWVLFFGVVFTIAQFLIANYFNLNNSFSILCSLGSAVIIGFFFDRFIGNISYRAREIWGPLIVAVVFYALIILGILLN